MQNQKPLFYYIGVADSIKRRLGEHFTRLDFIFYSIAYPCQSETYFHEVMRFYGEGLYPDHRDEYERQFLCYKSSCFTSVAWLSNQDLDYSVWSELETFYVSIYKPCVNFDKKDATPNERYRSIFLESRAHLLNHIHSRIVQNSGA